MEVILKKDVQKLGKAGDTVKVKDGFANNYLLRNGLAVPLNSSNIRRLEDEKQHKALESQKRKNAAEELGVKISSLSITLPVLVQEDDKLYGSITAQEISVALKEEGFEVDKNCIALEEPIKSLGIFEVPVKLHPEVSAKIKIWIVKK
ncbi:MAG: 50S ribosomal protein L9 [Candidatus Omnitrophota bacterium]